MPLWILLVLMFREIGITFVRMLMMRKGTAMAASVFGKAKAVTYMLSGIVGLFMHISGLIGLPQGLYDVIRVAGLVIFVVAALSSVLSF
jgi:CDP-diacylglycerol--glycerol-3-phosphate 3-phosphatidyltransferase